MKNIKSKVTPPLKPAEMPILNYLCVGAMLP